MILIVDFGRLHHFVTFFSLIMYFFLALQLNFLVLEKANVKVAGGSEHLLGEKLRKKFSKILVMS